jgi:hypothetical protein
MLVLNAFYISVNVSVVCWYMTEITSRQLGRFYWKTACPLPAHEKYQWWNDIFIIRLMKSSGLDSSVGIMTGYGLDGPGIESRWGRDLLQLFIPASCTTGTGSFPVVKSGRGVTLTPQPLLVPLVMKE